MPTSQSLQRPPNRRANTCPSDMKQLAHAVATSAYLPVQETVKSRVQQQEGNPSSYTNHSSELFSHPPETTMHQFSSYQDQTQAMESYIPQQGGSTRTRHLSEHKNTSAPVCTIAKHPHLFHQFINVYPPTLCLYGPWSMKTLLQHPSQHQTVYIICTVFTIMQSLIKSIITPALLQAQMQARTHSLKHVAQWVYIIWNTNISSTTHLVPNSVVCTSDRGEPLPPISPNHGTLSIIILRNSSPLQCWIID